MELRVLLRGFNESLCRGHGPLQKVNAIAVGISTAWQKERGLANGFRKELLWPHCAAREILVLQSGIEPIPPALEAQSLNHCGLPGKSPKFTIWTADTPLSFFLGCAILLVSSKNLLWLFCLVQGGDRPTQFQSTAIAGLPQARTTLN